MQLGTVVRLKSPSRGERNLAPIVIIIIWFAAYHMPRAAHIMSVEAQIASDSRGFQTVRSGPI